MRDAISDPTAGQRARDIHAFPADVRRRVDPTDPRYRHPRVESGQAMPNPDPTDPTYGPGPEGQAGPTGRRGSRHRRHAARPDDDPTEPHPEAGDRAEMRVLIRRSGRGVGTSLPTVIAARPLGHVHGLALGEGSTVHMRVEGSPVGQVFGRRRDKTLRAPAARRGYVLRLRGLGSA